jgi:hypothetical protein
VGLGVLAAEHRPVLLVAIVLLVALAVFIASTLVSSGTGPSSPQSAGGGPPTTVPRSRTAALGETVTVAGSATTGIASARVLSLSPDAVATTGPPAPRGQQYVATDIEVCAGPRAVNGPDVALFELVLPTGPVLPIPAITTLKPNLFTENVLAAGQCVHGFVTYQAPAGVTPTGVNYSPIAGYTVTWQA